MSMLKILTPIVPHPHDFRLEIQFWGKVDGWYGHCYTGGMTSTYGLGGRYAYVGGPRK